MNLEFPDVPSLRAKWVPVYLEPIEGSGERIVVGIALHHEDGKIICRQCINDSLLRALYKKQKNNFKELANIGMYSIAEHLKRGGGFHNWIPPISGIHIGEPRVGAGRNFDEIFYQAFSLTSSLATVLLTEEQKVSEKNVRLQSAIKNEVILLRPKMKDFFNAKIRLSSAETEASFMFYNKNYVANACSFQALRFGQSMEKIKSSLWDIHFLKEVPTLTPLRKSELLIRLPQFKDGSGLDADEVEESKQKFMESMEEINEEATKKGINIFTFNEPSEASFRIVSIAEAA